MRTESEQNDKQLIAHLAGTMDVLAELINREHLTDTQLLQRIRPLINRCKKHQDEWFDRQARGERVIK
ncbi:hypothetical protein OAU81_00670 [bacterium]|nr:hypothetical protein [bacterium]